MGQNNILQMKTGTSLIRTIATSSKAKKNEMECYLCICVSTRRTLLWITLKMYAYLRTPEVIYFSSKIITNYHDFGVRLSLFFHVNIWDPFFLFSFDYKIVIFRKVFFLNRFRCIMRRMIFVFEKVTNICLVKMSY